MRTIAFTVWGGRIAPVFESSSQLCLLELEGGRIIRQSTLCMPGLFRLERIEMLSENMVDTLVCGAISNFYASMLEAQGIEVIGFISGDFSHVFQAYLNGTIKISCSMPGCRRRRRRRRRGGNQL